MGVMPALWYNRPVPSGGWHPEGGARGHDPGFEDACLAATADHHGMTVVTCNVRQFRALGVPFLSPGQSEEDAP